MVTDIVRYTLGSVVAFMLLPLIVTFWLTKTHIYTDNVKGNDTLEKIITVLMFSSQIAWSALIVVALILLQR